MDKGLHVFTVNENWACDFYHSQAFSVIVRLNIYAWNSWDNWIILKRASIRNDGRNL